MSAATGPLAAQGLVGVERLKPGNGLPIAAEKKPTYSLNTVNAYGPPDDETAARLKDLFAKEAGNPDALADHTGIAYDKLGLLFTLFKDKVYQIWIDAPPPEPAAQK
jgi:hypothetical protein